MLFTEFWNIMLATDSYKASHHAMLPEDLEYMESYGESRGGEFYFTVFFGMQYYLKSYLGGVQVTEEKIKEAVEFYNQHFGIDNVFNEAGWRHILTKHGGKLPLKIEAVKEGSIIPTSNMLYKISSTDKKCAWLVNWVETLLMKTWYPITIATNSIAGKEILKLHWETTGETSNVDFLLHDFGYRGVASEEQAWIGGAAHLLSFKGTDTIAGIRMLQKYYEAPMCGFSVPASEHMVMTVRGRDKEIETYREILRNHGLGTKFENVPLSLVSDTYDVMNVCRFIFDDEECRKLIMERKAPFVIRPDSGDPAEILDECMTIVADKFGYTTNSKGFKTVYNKIKFLQGDGITIYTMHEILNKLEAKGWSIDNLIFGSGGGLLQSFNRYTLKFAIKAAYAIIGGVGVDVYKDPITAKGSKKSKRGILRTIFNPEFGYKTINQYDTVEGEDMLQLVFLNGDLFNIQTYEDILHTMSIEEQKLDNLVTHDGE